MDETGEERVPREKSWSGPAWGVVGGKDRWGWEGEPGEERVSARSGGRVIWVAVDAQDREAIGLTLSTIGLG